MNELLPSLSGLSPADWKAFGTTAGRIAVILALAWILQIAARRLIRTFRIYMASRTSTTDEARRIETLGRVFRYAAAVVIAIVAGTLVLGELGVSVAPILATAGVAGVAIGFGAQSLIRDYFNGFFLLLEDQVRQGDIVEIGGMGGLVEELTLRHVKLRNFEGHVIYVPNGEIKIVKNLTREYARAVIEIGVAYREDADEALDVMREVGAAMRGDARFGPLIAEDIELIGVERWADSAVILRARLKVVPPIEQFNVRREYLKRLKKAFDARGIEIPYPHLTLYPGRPKKGDAPALRVLAETRPAAQG
jgi:small-conductance mechanosensitive channel